MQPVYIYVLRDPRTELIRYVGKSVHPKQRRRDHNSLDPLRHRNPHKHHWVLQLHALGLKPIFEVIQEANETNYIELEQFWIDYFRKVGMPLTNLTDGGEGRLGHSVSETTRIKLREANKNRVITEDQRERISNSLKAYYAKHGPPANTKDPVLRAQRGAKQRGKKRKPLTEEHKARLRAFWKSYYEQNPEFAVSRVNKIRGVARPDVTERLKQRWAEVAASPELKKQVSFTHRLAALKWRAEKKLNGELQDS